MPQNVQELIGRIRKEGLEASQQQAREIEQQAREKAARLLAEAQEQAARILAEAATRREKTEQSTRASLQQAARDTLLALRQEINAQLGRILRKEVRDALDDQRMAELVAAIVTDYAARSGTGAGIRVALADGDRERLQQRVLARLQESLRGGVTLQAADGAGGGFAISFDAGASWFDFSEPALADYLARHVNEYVAGLLKS